MASGKTNYLKDLYIVHKTEVSVNPGLGSNSGRGYSITVTPPTGYSIVSHIQCYHEGAAGMNLTFDYVD